MHPRCMRARCTCGARQMTVHVHGRWCTAHARRKHAPGTSRARCLHAPGATPLPRCHPLTQVPPEEPMQGAPPPAAALPPAASPAPPAVGAVALSLILSPSLMASAQPRRRPPSPRRRAAPPRRRPTSPRAEASPDASPRARAPPTRADAPTGSPSRRAAHPGPRRRGVTAYVTDRGAEK